jgi:Ca2+-binding EF-hand superfamily protein
MTARFKTGAAVAALFAATFATAVMAEKGHGGPEGRGEMLLQMFDTIDADKDGKLTEAEIEAHRAAEFTAADTNADGMLNAEELTAQHMARMSQMAADHTTQMIERTDDNGDGNLSAEEMTQTVQERRFAQLDQDEDGAISKAEAEDAGDRFMERRKKRHHEMHDEGEN